jgi:muramoyltetrapeptide carboxypeptidase LdcA involved in peptidoglycan recycling
MPPERFKKFIPFMERYLKEEGFLVKRYLANENADVVTLAQNFTNAWLDPDTRAIFPICGSERIFEVIEHLNPCDLKIKPIIFCGSSALSVMSLWLMTHAQLTSFFGPHLPFLQTYAPQRETEFSVQSFWSMVMWKKGRVKRISSVHEKHHFFSVRDSSVVEMKIPNIYFRSDLINDEKRRDAKFYTSITTPVKGTTFCITLGALIALKRNNQLTVQKGSIVFTETMDWTFQQVKNAFIELAQSGIFERAKALFLTTLSERTDRKVRLYPELRDEGRVKELCEYLSNLLSLPVLYGFPMGHGAYKLTIPQGVECVVDPIDGSVNLLEPPVM